MSKKSISEAWKVVPGYEGLYEVSNHGRVRSLINNARNKRRTPKTLKLFLCAPSKYLMIRLSNNTATKTLRVHRLVAAAFFGNPTPEKPVVNHIDFDETNNHVDNLEWCSQKQNIAHSSARRARGERHGMTKLTAAKVRTIRKRYSGGESSYHLADAFGVGSSTILRIFHRECWGHID